ncbi:hypothetical protein BCV70DRAFT_160059 [Testicularia cyperi]|uniref:Uncharacterized protein n=1 Tax=Testicularia cyperi TaxID=1882483 RepID=A0A317XS91_9BASI|nr:hypothetical protein BCV70DRAFT_160059 [Testicularia cyperi]
MGNVFSCLASTFLYLGEFLENVFLALGEIGAVLVRAIFGIVISLCDLLAAISCCYRVPWSERPDRSYFNYQTNLATTDMTSVGSKQVLGGVFTKEGREHRKVAKEARKKALEIKAEADAAAQKEQKEARQKAKKEAADAKLKEKEEKAAAQKKAKEAKQVAAANVSDKQ